jgi:hypothetical protein
MKSGILVLKMSFRLDVFCESENEEAILWKKHATLHTRKVWWHDNSRTIDQAEELKSRAHDELEHGRFARG